MKQSKPKYLVLCDLDGTLLNNEGKISKRNETVVKKFVKAGNIFCLATGRPKRGAIDFYNQLDLNSILINYNGSYISNPSNNLFAPLNLGFSNHILHVIMANKKVLRWVDNILVENSEGNFIWKEPQSEEEANALFSHFHIEKTAHYRLFDKKLSIIKTDINSILIDMKSEKYINLLVSEIKSLTNTLIVRNWSVPNLGTIIEINSIFSSKGTALKYLSSYYGIPIENCIAFGDQDNDANMLTKANHSYAMKNGSTTAKLSAKYMTKKTNNEDGVAFELVKYISKK